MKLETKYDFGDVVYSIHKNMQYDWEPCKFCDSTGRIVGANSEDRHCPECLGRKGAKVCTEQAYEIEDTRLTVGQVRVEVTAERKQGDDSIFENYGHQEAKRKEEYMCYETGIGSGRFYNVKNLFPSQTEALAECEARNNADSK